MSDYWYNSEARYKYEDWVTEQDRSRFFRVEQTIGALEDNPILREAASTLFWQVFFYLEAVETARPISGLEELISSADPATCEKAMVELERLKAQLQGEWANFDLTLLNRIHNTSLMLSETTRDALAREPNEL